MNETSTFRRLAAALTICSFAVAALIGIVALLGGGHFGDSEARVLGTTLIVGCTSVCMLCYLATSGTRWASVGATGGVTVILPAATSLLLLWSESAEGSEAVWRSYGVGVVAAATLAQICLLLALAGEREALAVVLWPTVVLAVVAALVASGMILGDEGPGDTWRLLGVVGILDVLGTVVTIAVAKFGGTGRRPGDLAEATADPYLGFRS